MTTMNIRLDRLLTVADRLEAQPERFDFGWWCDLDNFGPHNCGTTGCSLGHAVEIFGAECGVIFAKRFGRSLPSPGFPGNTEYEPIKAAQAIFGDLSPEDFARLFLPAVDDDGVLDEDCTAAEAAAEIRKYVAEKRAEVNP